jgi:hypothetical protein
MATQFTIDTSYTDAQMLAFVKQAIIEVVAGGQSYALPGGRQWTGADLAKLHAMETAYQSRVDAESYGMPVNLARGVR